MSSTRLHLLMSSLLVFLLNRVLYIVSYFRPLNLSAAKKKAMEATGLSELGTESCNYRSDFATVLTEAQTNFTPFGHFTLYRFVEKHLTNRLLKELALKQSPEILRVPISKPVFIIGVQRTGTTLLHTLFSLDPQVRSPQNWELQDPFPSPEEGGRDSDPRYVKAVSRASSGVWFLPFTDYFHPTRPGGPDECLMAMSMDVEMTFSPFVCGLSSAFDELLTADLSPVYRNYRSTLQALTWKHAPRSHLVLKSTLHNLDLRSLVEVFPDCSLLWVHRPPEASVRSYAHGIHSISETFCSNPPTAQQAGAKSLQVQSTLLRRGALARAQYPEVAARIVDVLFDDVVKNPVGVVRAVNRRLGYPDTEEWHDAMHKWIAGDRVERERTSKGRQVQHQRGLKDFGLTQEVLQESFREYQEMLGQIFPIQPLVD